MTPPNTRQRIDYVNLPGGGVKAILTVTLPGGVVKRFEAITTAHEAQSVEGDIVGAELALSARTVGAFRPLRALKKVGKLGAKLASSKVFKLAAAGLAAAAPLLGPIAPVALAAAGGMAVASKLAKAGVAAAKGAQGVAQALTQSAAKDAVRLTGSAEGARALLDLANRRRLGAEKAAERTPEPAAAPSSSSSAARAPMSRARMLAPASSPAARSATDDLLARARAGLVRSSSGAPVSAAQLLAAHRAGRIFWVS
jgi:hypothetical protein